MNTAIGRDREQVREALLAEPSAPTSWEVDVYKTAFLQELALRGEFEGAKHGGLKTVMQHRGLVRWPEAVDAGFMDEWRTYEGKLYLKLREKCDFERPTYAPGSSEATLRTHLYVVIGAATELDYLGGEKLEEERPLLVLESEEEAEKEVLELRSQAERLSRWKCRLGETPALHPSQCDCGEIPPHDGLELLFEEDFWGYQDVRIRLEKVLFRGKTVLNSNPSQES